MTVRTLEDAWTGLVERLAHLESILPSPRYAAPAPVVDLSLWEKRFELEEEIRDLEEFIDNAEEPQDPHSAAALAFLQTELIRKRSLLDDM
jgi:hypothetical protein